MTLVAAGGRAADLILPVALLVGAAAVAAYSSLKRRRRAATRTTPHGGPPPEDPGARAERALRTADGAVRAAEETLSRATVRWGEEAVRPFARAVAQAREELAAALRLRRRLDEGAFEDEASRRRTLDEIVARCVAAGRRLDAEREAADRLFGGPGHRGQAP
ncbi:hypothetical protein [Streptomyces sp. NPDC006368]|uniref:hypothetical protein n=1 Tax=Streptomyces sp. NPDC006368 TaxID=3156760 RepID=UPI0033BB37B7